MRYFDLFENKDELDLPSIEVGDEVMVGKFKNRKAVVKGFTKDDHNQPVLKTDKGDQKLFKPRISKLEEDINFQKSFYHGTAREEINFRNDRVAYFSSSYKDAVIHANMDAEYGDGIEPYVIEVKLHIKNPIMLDTMLMQDLHLPEHAAYLKELLSKGYDAAYSNNSDLEICVFDPKSIEIVKTHPVN